MSLSRLIEQLDKAPLLKRICLYGVGLGVVVSVLLVSSLVIYEYINKTEQAEKCLDNLITSHTDAISEGVWSRSDDKVKSLLESMVFQCRTNVFSVKPSLLISIEYDDGKVVKVGQTSKIPSYYLEQTHPISYWKGSEAQAYWLGQLVIRQDIDDIVSGIVKNAVFMLVSNLIVIACVALLCVFLGYFTVIKRIRTLMRHFKEQSVNESVGKISKLEVSEVSELWLTLVEFKQEMQEMYLQTDAKLKLCQSELRNEKRNSEMKSHFLAKLSHELRTPMNGLLGFSSLLLESKLEDEQREYAQTIQASLESLLYVVNDVLDLSRIESGELIITSIPFNLRGVLSGVSNLLKNRAESKGLQFETRISPELPQTLRGDPVRIRQVLMNLVSNSIQHTAKGYILINAELLSSENGRATIRLSIEDTGEKLRKKNNIDKPENVESGFSAELREKRSLGLDICFQLVELMGSKLLSEDRADSGSTYWFDTSLPIIKQSQSNERLDLSSVRALKVLVIDSYELSRKITLELLSQWGIQFDAVPTAADGIKLIHQNTASEEPYNMVLCDDLLQDLSGIEACQMIKQITPNTPQIVILCSNPQLGDAENFFLAGASGFLSKQFRDPFLRGVMCQAYAERNRKGNERRLITRYTVTDVDDEKEVQKTNEKQAERRAKVLIVEDNIVNQQLVMRMLERNGCQVDLAANGFEGIELYKKNKYDLIFMDCLMPEMDGYETTQIIREIERSNANRVKSPIIALTAHAFEEEADRCFQVGMDEFMTKPFKIAQLEMVLERYIN